MLGLERSAVPWQLNQTVVLLIWADGASGTNVALGDGSVVNVNLSDVTNFSGSAKMGDPRPLLPSLTLVTPIGRCAGAGRPAGIGCGFDRPYRSAAQASAEGAPARRVVRLGGASTSCIVVRAFRSLAIH